MGFLGLGFLMPALVHTDPTHSKIAICQLVTSAHVMSGIVHLAQHSTSIMAVLAEMSEQYL